MPDVSRRTGSSSRNVSAIVAVLWIAFTVFVAVGCGNGGAESKKRLPNVLFVLTDEHRWDMVGCFGNDVLRTPNLDRLASEGARLDRFYVAAPLCSPSRASFLSGLYPRQSGVMDNRDRAEFPSPVATVATCLERAGYRTGFVGKAHMGGDPKRWGFADIPVLLAKGGAHLDESTLVFDGEPRDVTGPVTSIFIDEAVRYLEEHRDERWFLWVSTRAAHRPYVNDPDHAYDASEITPPPGWPADQPLSDHDWPGYYSTVSFLDEEIGRLLDTLDRLDLSKDTLVLFAGDNGSMYGSHGESRKQVWYEECARTPAIVRWPDRIPAGKAVSAPVVSVDFLPTLLDLCDFEPDSTLEGKSMLPALTGETPLRAFAFSELDREPRFGGGYWRMLRGDRYKYVRFDDGTEHLYDLETDPSESSDLAASAEHSAVLQSSKERLDRWMRDYPGRP